VSAPSAKPTSAKPLYARFLAAAPERLHFAAHSHHFWPDVTREAQLRAWDEAAAHADRKWEFVLGRVMPEAQANVAAVLGTSTPDRIAFAPNTHELAVRLLSCLPSAPVPEVLTSDGEFHSFARQLHRLEEAGVVRVRRVPVEPAATFAERFRAEATRGEPPALVFVSQVFFNSGHSVGPLAAFVAGLPSTSLICIDGYHAFHALPFRLGDAAARVFYLAGGYKYAQAGEGACFLHLPTGAEALRPLNTGWFAAFGALESAGRERDATPYGAGAYRFLGSTFDPSALYRWNAVCALFRAEGWDVAAIHAHVLRLQTRFLAGVQAAEARGAGPLAALFAESVRAEALVNGRSAPAEQAHFLCFEAARAGELSARLLEAGIVTDARGTRLRFGFGLYQDADDIARLFERVRKH
jgi:kynureninase